MNALRFLKRPISNLMSHRTINTSRANTKAVKNWERPSIEEMTVPKDPWQRVFDKNQKRYNAHLLAGLAIFSGTALVLNANVFFNATPDYLKSVKYSTKTPSKNEDEVEDEGGSAPLVKDEVEDEVGSAPLTKDEVEDEVSSIPQAEENTDEGMSFYCYRNRIYLELMGFS